MAALSREEKLQLASQKLRQFQQSKQAGVDKSKANAPKIPDSSPSEFNAIKPTPAVVSHSTIPAYNYPQIPNYSLQSGNTGNLETVANLEKFQSTETRSIPTTSTEQMRELVAHCNTLLNSVESADDNSTIGSASDVETSFDTRFRNDDNDQENERLRQRNLELVQLIETLRNEGESRQIELVKYRRLFESLEREYGEALRSSSPQHALSVFQRSVEQLAAECAEQSRKATVNESKLETERAEFLKQHEALSAENSELRRKLAFIEQQNVALQDSVSRAARDTGKLEHEIVASRSLFDSEKARFEREIARLEADSVSQRARLETEVAMQKSTIQVELETLRNELENSRLACRKSQEDFELLKSTLTKVSDEKLKMAEQIDRLEADLRAAATQSRRDTDIEAELNETRTVLGRVRIEYDSENRRLRSELETESQHHQRLLDENAKIKKALEEVALRYNALETVERDAAARCSAAQSELETMRLRLNETQQKVSDRDRLQSNLQEAGRKFEADLRVKQQRILELETVIEDRDARLRRADIDLRNADAELARLRNLGAGANNETENRLRLVELQFRELQAEADRLRPIEARHRELESELDRLRKIEARVHEYQSAANRLSELQPELDRLRKLEAEFKAESERLHQLESQCRDHQPELDRLYKMEAGFRSRTEANEAQLRESEAELDRLRNVEVELRNTIAEMDRRAEPESTPLTSPQLDEATLTQLRNTELELRDAQAELARLRHADAQLHRLTAVEIELHNAEAELRRLRDVESQFEEYRRSNKPPQDASAGVSVEELKRIEDQAEKHVNEMRIECEKYVVDVQKQFESHFAQVTSENEQRIAELLEQTADIKKQRDITIAELQRDYEDRFSELRTVADDARRELETARAENVSTRQRFEQALGALQSELQVARSASVSHSQQLQSSAAAVEDAVVQREVESLRASLRAADSTIDELRANESTLTTRCAELSNRAALSEAQARAALSDVERERAASAQLAARLRDATAYSDALAALRSEADASRVEAQQAVAERDRLAVELEAFKTERSRLISQLAAVSDAKSNASHHVEKAAAKADAASATEMEMPAFSAAPLSEGEANDELRRMKNLLMRREAEVHQLGAEMARLTAERATSETRCAQHESVAAFLRRRNAELEHSVEQLSAECESIGDYIAMYHSQRQALLERVERKKTLLHRLLVERRIFDNSLAQLRSILQNSGLHQLNAATYVAPNWPKLDSDSDSEAESSNHSHSHNNQSLADAHGHGHGHVLNQSQGVNERQGEQLTTVQLLELGRVVSALETALQKGNETSVHANAELNESSLKEPSLVNKHAHAALATPVSGPSSTSARTPPLDRVLIDDAYFAPCKHCSGKLITV